RANGFDLRPAVERLAADEQMRNAARFDRIDVPARDVLRVLDKAPEQNRDVPWLNRDATVAAVGASLGDRPSVFPVDDPGNECTDRIGQRLLDRPRRHRPAPAIWPWHGQRHERRLGLLLSASSPQPHAARLTPPATPTIS